MKTHLLALVLSVGSIGEALADDAALIEPTSLIWERFLDGSSQDVASGAAILSSGDIALVGTTGSGPGRDKTGVGFGSDIYDDAWIVVTDPSGRKRWDTVLGGPSFDGFNDVASLANGRLLCAGHSSSDAGPGKFSRNISGSDVWVVCLDSDGRHLWDKSYGLGWTESGMSLCVVDSQKVAVAGASDGRGYLLLINPDGGVIAQKFYGPVVESISAVRSAPDSSLFLCGYTSRRELWVAKTAPGEVDLAWSFVLSSPHPTHGLSLVALRDGGALACGGSFYASLEGGEDGVGVMVKLDAAGRVVWQREYRFGLKRNMVLGVAELNGNGFVASGTFGSVGSQKHFLARLGGDGQLLWKNVFSAGTWGANCATLQCADGGFLVLGSSSIPAFDMDIHLVKFAPELTAAQADPPVLSVSPRLGSHLGQDGFHFSLIGKPNHQYITERTVDFLHWQPFTTNTAFLTDTKLVDPMAFGRPKSEYRTREVTP
ncbi:MAG: PQQ-binding-like beta-propeller repeat protein [Verrucomicrobiales bacterium]|nr:PQQ-binding-like beta-propeller repeat protein [Verrucomicrobiales bacterium]